jgi:hypothetical protein
MKTFSILAISAMVFFSIAAVPVSNKTTPSENQGTFSDEFSSLRTHRQGRGAEVTWSFLSSDASCFVVQRTNEDPNDPYSVWITVENVGCDLSRSYKCHDENPFPGLINYRVLAVMKNGTTITSGISTVHIAAR